MANNTTNFWNPCNKKRKWDPPPKSYSRQSHVVATASSFSHSHTTSEPSCHSCRHRCIPLVECRACALRFCGVCLKRRHGEDIEVELQDPYSWLCPKCRNGCGPGCSNCCLCPSCQKEKGLPPTGSLIHKAKNSGFTNVHDYLIHKHTGETAEKISYRKNRRGWCKSAENSVQQCRQSLKRVKAQREIAADEKQANSLLPANYLSVESFIKAVEEKMNSKMHSYPGFFYSYKETPSSNSEEEAVTENTNQERLHCMSSLKLKVKEEPSFRDSPNQIDMQHSAPWQKTEEEEIDDNASYNDEDYMVYLKSLPDDDYLYFLNQIRYNGHSLSADLEVKPEGSITTVKYEELENGPMSFTNKDRAGLNHNKGAVCKCNVGMNSRTKYDEKRCSSLNKQSKHHEANGECLSHQSKKRHVVQEKFIQRKVNVKTRTIQENTYLNDDDESVVSDDDLNMTTDDFKKKLEAVLGKPFCPREFREKWNLISTRKPRIQYRQTRQTSFRVETNEDGFSYLDYYPDLAKKLKETDSHEEKLRLMRGFFLWLKHASWSSSFQPWVSVTQQNCSSGDVGDDDCMVIDGLECEFVAEVLPVEDCNSKYPERGNKNLVPKVEIISEASAEYGASSFSFVPKRVKKEIEIS